MLQRFKFEKKLFSSVKTFEKLGGLSVEGSLTLVTINRGMRSKRSPIPAFLVQPLELDPEFS